MPETSKNLIPLEFEIAMFKQSLQLCGMVTADVKKIKDLENKNRRFNKFLPISAWNVRF